MNIFNAYNPYDWYWIVAGDSSRAWSSAAGAYVTLPDGWYPSVQAAVDSVGGAVDDVLLRVATPIASEADLNAALRPHGLILPAPEQVDFESAIQAHVDAAAKARNYTDGASLAGYYASTIPEWAAESGVFIAWRDTVWTYAYEQLAAVQNGQRPKPSVAAFVAELPTLEWPA